MTPKIYAADFRLFGRRTRRAWKRKEAYTHAYFAVRTPDAQEWQWVTDYYFGFSKSRKHAEAQINKRRNSRTDKWTGPFDIVEVREEPPPNSSRPRPSGPSAGLPSAAVRAAGSGWSGSRRSP